jgi:hypothetical protein
MLEGHLHSDHESQAQIIFTEYLRSSLLVLLLCKPAAKLQSEVIVEVVPDIFRSSFPLHERSWISHLFKDATTSRKPMNSLYTYAYSHDLLATEDAKVHIACER